jgi:hypothetical protein
MRSVVSAFLVLVICTFASGQSSPYARDLVKGTGYTIALPPDVIVNLAPTEETSHGFGLDLIRPGDEHAWNRVPMRYIAFNTRWDAGDLPSLESVVDRMVRDPVSLVPDDANQGEVRVVSNFPVKLADLPARRIVVEFKNAEKRPAIRQIVVAYRARPEATGLVYVGSLTTTRTDFQQDVGMFARLLAGFKLTSVE